MPKQEEQLATYAQWPTVTFGDNMRAEILKQRMVKGRDGSPMRLLTFRPTTSMIRYCNLERKLDRNYTITRPYWEDLILQLNDDPVHGGILVLTTWDWQETTLMDRFRDRRELRRMRQDKFDLLRQVARLKDELRQERLHSKKTLREDVDLVKEMQIRQQADVASEGSGLPAGAAVTGQDAGY